ncbi:MAG: Leucyl aminopeptidase T [Thermotoga sp. 50_1627]|uniref:leucyl aminopeptidase n=1 Tax=Pseudothermotoga sp. TaxID=2033661 RepID=UPI00076C8B1A|nr:MAG: Leucyl aminopeptidase T [Thermotoga sp. 50_64]KUK24612.1 MAG: Leucyl aminopeptidase T [Thermotoga sp. 50_1627]MBC7117133.1 leucyl aminopeptidase [Pseudothermotoga sp.]
MAGMLEFEVAKAAYLVVTELCKVKRGESVLITVDSAMDFKPAEETAKAAEAVGAKVMVAWHSTPRGYGKVADDQLPEPLKAAIPASDVWIEFNNQWLLYNTAWTKAMATGRTRYLFLGGLDRERITRCIARIEIDLQEKFQNKVVELTKKARKMRITTPAGTDVSFENVPERPVTNELRADTPGPHFLLGQIGWAPLEESINGVIVFDGSFSGGGEADLGVLAHPIELVVKEGRIIEIRGQEEAKFLRRWLEKLNDPRMYYLAHVCYGFNPGAKLSGLCTEDERVWGSTEWGFGYQGPAFKGKLGEAVSHADGICLNSTVWIDGELLLEEGKVVHPELVDLARAMGK